MRHISARERRLPEQEIEKLIEIAAEDPTVVSIGPGEPNFGLPRPLIGALRGMASKVNHYAPPGGFLSLREAICRKARKDNRIRNASPENVVVTCGSQEALLLATACTLDPRERIIIPDPSFMAYLPTIKLFNAKPIFWKLDPWNGFEPDPDELRRTIIPRNTGALILNTPANPTGNVIRKKVLEEIADIAVEHDLYVFADEAYEALVYDDAKHVSFASLNGMQDYALTFQTFSKTYAMAGFRLGYVIAPPELAAAIRKSHVYSTIAAPTVSQRLGEAALRLPRRHVEAMRRSYDRRRRIAVDRLNGMGLPTPMPSGAFYTFSDITRTGYDSRRFALALLREGHVAAVPGTDFGAGGEGFVRCSFATEEMQLVKGLDRMEKFVRSLNR